MKKMIFSSMFVLAFFFAAETIWAQCDSNELNPVAGTAYDYEVTVSSSAGTDPTYFWYVTQNANLLLQSDFLPEGTYFIVETGSGFSNYQAASGTTSKIRLTWTAAAVTGNTPFYLVVKYSERRAGDCEVENMKAWKIQPSSEIFTLAIASVDSKGNATTAPVCPPPIDGATVNNNGTVTYTYGTTLLYYKVTAAGLNGVWEPSVKLSNLAGSALNQIYLSVSWSADGNVWNSFVDTGNGDRSYTSAVMAPVAAAGSEIIVKIEIQNGNYESLIEQEINLGIDGVANGNIQDVKASNDCTVETLFGKTASHIIMPRPALTEANPTVPFMTKNP